VGASGSALELNTRAMLKPSRVVCFRDKEGAFVRLAMPFKTRAEPEKERDEILARPEYRKLALGVGFVR
jgi:hypothetical protein